MAKNRLRTLIWILDTIYRTGGVSRRELNRRWMESSLNEQDLEFPRRTLDEYLKAIRDMFDINIVCLTSNGYKYRIENVDDIRKNYIKKWLLSTLTVNNLTIESKKLRKRILFENIPSGNDFLVAVVQAMKDSTCIELTYQSFHKDIPSTYVVEPYCVKVFKQRWYMLDKSPDEDILRIHALDRIIEARPTTQKFEFPSTFDAQAYFRDCFGIIRDTAEYEVETIRVKVTDTPDGHKRRYFRLLPLHESQQEVEKYPDYSIFEYRLYPSYDFIQEILSHGSEVEILSPENVREDIRGYIELMHSMYKKK